MWLVPTRRRIEKLKVFLQSVIDTKATTPGVLLVEKNEFIELANGYKELVLPNGWIFYLTGGDSMGEKVSEYWEKNKNNHNWFGILNDDFFCVTEGWDTKALKALDAPFIGIVSTDDGWKAPQRATGAFACTATFLSALGFFYPPGLKHNFIDDVYEILGQFTQSWFCNMDVRVEHRHLAKTDNSPKDSTFHKAKDYFPDDCQAFQKWVESDLNQAVARIRVWQVLRRYNKTSVL